MLPPSPYAWNGLNQGCGDVVLYDVSLSGQRLLVASFGRANVGLAKAGDTVTVDLATGKASVRLDVYASGLTELPVCNDVGVHQSPISTARAVSGSLTVTLETVPAAPGETFYVSAHLSNVQVRNANGALEMIQDDDFKHVLVGWYAG